MKKRTKSTQKLQLLLPLLLPLLVLAAAGCVLVLWLAGREPEVRGEHRRELLSSMGLLGDFNGFWVTCGPGGERDFPFRDGLDNEELSARLDELLDLTDRARLNTVFFQARAEGAAFYQSKYFDPHPSLGGTGKGFDPLERLCAAGLEKRIQVYAVLDAGEGPGGKALDLTQSDGLELLAASTEELAGNYPVAGVLLSGVEKLPEDSFEALFRTVKARLKKKAPSAALGVIFPGESDVPTHAVNQLTEERTLNIVVPRLDIGTSFYERLEKWCEAAPSARVLPALPAYAKGSEEERQLELRLLAVSMEERVSGVVLEGYGDIRRDQQQAERLSSLVNSPKGPAPDLDFDLPQVLSVTYPAEDAAVTDPAIFLMGTSDPERPLTLDGEEVERFTDRGTWGSLQKLEMGANIFTLRQGEETRTVTIKRYTPGPAAPIREITEGSIFPRYPCGVDSDAQLTLSCIAPAGGTVTATLGGTTVTLEPEGTASQGTPLAYRGTLSLEPADYPSDATTNIGPVAYRLSYNGEETDYQSQGEVCVAGRNVPLAVENTAQLSAVLTDPDNDETIVGTLKPGARVTVEETVRTSRSGAVTLAYRLSGGGYILAGTPSLGDMVTILEGAPEDLSMEIGEVDTVLDEKGGLTVTLGEGTPGITTDRTGEALILDCRDTAVTGELSQLTNGFVSSASAQEIAGGTRLVLRLDPSKELWGYDLCYEDGKTLLYLRPAPEKSDRFGRPLDGLSVLLDPGHGGSDPGAMGVAGSFGPAEAQLNLAVSQAVKYRLEQLGATVTLTRDDDSQVSLTQRVDDAAALRPDLFLSIHHNSGVLTGNMNQARRMECYYFEDSSQPFAQLLMDVLPEVIGRPGTGPEQARYYVTRQTANPAVLLEVGFMVNPLEYEECVDKEKILETAWGIGEAIQRLVETSE